MADPHATAREATALDVFMADIAFPEWVREHYDALAADLAAAHTREQELREELDRALEAFNVQCNRIDAIEAIVTGDRETFDLAALASVGDPAKETTT